MTVTVDVRDDPDHPEGGHASILFRSVSRSSGAATLLIEPLTEGFDYRGPRRIDVAGRAVEGGFEIAVGTEMVSALPPGIALNLSLAGTGFDADVRWPTLAQKRTEPKRRVVQPGRRREVVDGAGHATAGPATVSARSKTIDREPPVIPAREEMLPDPRDGQPTRVEPAEQGGVQGKAARLEPSETNGPLVPPLGAGLPLTPPTIMPLASPAKPGWRTGSVAAATVLAFVAGAGTTGAFWFWHPMPAPAAASVATLPSPYEMLNALSDRSPRGIPVEAGRSTGLRARGQRANTADEASFWYKWATRSLLKARSNDAAATLSDFATDLAKDPGDPPALAAARFLWEMAALASDCAAMDNIATALVFDGKAGADRQAAVWRDRAKLCRDRVKPG